MPGDGRDLRIGRIDSYPPGDSEHDRSGDIGSLYCVTRFKERL
ncbi:hypothetical protein V473_16250 [Sphingobium cupriresistens LL01]|uniref:Uncharacterized protein n=1 Tax=Sphingobium cupriresistens LL01 TaxID=1420583 RepID=A0A0J7XR92_9SPHN|nr:hypothetical protein V473_16250 [Sphingobium cupriresistens LL01]